MNTHVILAEDIGLGVLFYVTLGVMVLTLCGLYPAFKGAHKMTLWFIAPAVVWILALACIFGFVYVKRPQDANALLSDYVWLWVFFAVPSAVTIVIPVSILMWRRTRLRKV